MALHESEFNTAILCVDDEPGILEAYQNTLVANENVDRDIENMLSRRKRRKAGQNEQTASVRKKLTYEVFTASSGEEAVDIVHEQLAASRQIAAGFFDMAMPGGDRRCGNYPQNFGVGQPDALCCGYGLY